MSFVDLLANSPKQLQSTKDKLDDSQKELQMTKDKVTDSQKQTQNLTNETKRNSENILKLKTKNKLNNDDLLKCKTQLEITKEKLSHFQNQLKTMKDKLVNSQNNVKATKAKLADPQTTFTNSPQTDIQNRPADPPKKAQNNNDKLLDFPKPPDFRKFLATKDLKGHSEILLETTENTRYKHGCFRVECSVCHARNVYVWYDMDRNDYVLQYKCHNA